MRLMESIDISIDQRRHEVTTSLAIDARGHSSLQERNSNVIHE